MLPTFRRWIALAAVLLAALGSLALAPAAHAAERVVTLTDGGVDPAVLTVSPGDRVRFAVLSRPADRVRSSSGNWTFDSCPLELLGCPSGYTVPLALTAPGTYTYTATRGTQVRSGSVVVPAPPPPPPPPVAAPKPGPAGTAPAPPATGGTGRTALPPLTGGFGPAMQPGGPVPGGFAPAPTLALPLLPEGVSGPLPATAPAPGVGPLTNLAVAGDLPGQTTVRRYGLPAVLAAVLAAGVLSLLLRLLLSEPAAPGRTRSAPR